MLFKINGIEVRDGNLLSEEYLDACIEKMEMLLVIHYGDKDRPSRILRDYINEHEDDFEITHVHLYANTREITMGIKNVGKDFKESILSKPTIEIHEGSE